MFPIEAGEARPFVPPSLAKLPDPPSFTFKPATRREKRLHRRLLKEEGLSWHSEPAVRAELLRAIEANWSADLVAEHQPRLRAYWDALDYHRKETPDDLFLHPDQDHIESLIEQAARAWPPLRKMDADNDMFRVEGPAILASCLLTGWDGPVAPFRLDGGRVPLDCLDDLAEELAALEVEHAGADGVGLAGTAFMQICGEAASLLYVTETERKNSASPSPSTSTPSDSPTPEMDGTSTAPITTGTPET